MLFSGVSNYLSHWYIEVQIPFFSPAAFPKSCTATIADKDDGARSNSHSAVSKSAHRTEMEKVRIEGCEKAVPSTSIFPHGPLIAFFRMHFICYFGLRRPLLFLRHTESGNLGIANRSGRPGKRGRHPLGPNLAFNADPLSFWHSMLARETEHQQLQSIFLRPSLCMQTFFVRIHLTFSLTLRQSMDTQPVSSLMIIKCIAVSFAHTETPSK